MTSLLPPRCWILLAILFALVQRDIAAQEPASVRKVVLPSLDSQVRARFVALDRKLNPVHSPRLAGSLVAQFSPLVSPLSILAPLLVDRRNAEIWEQLPEEYYRLMMESGEALVAQTEPPLTGTAWSSEQARRLCQQRLASLPRASLEWYRQRVDVEAKALLEDGRRTRSPLPLRRVVDELFCSSVGDQALDLLGDLAFERGDFTEARHWWGLLSPFPSTGSPRENRMRFPDPKIDGARTRAKLILALIFQGRLDEAQEQIKRFREQHPSAKGSLAGQQDLYATILRKTLAGFVRDRVVNNDDDWPTFGGAATGNRVLSQGLAWHLWVDGPSWKVKLPTLSPDGKPREPLLERGGLARRAAFHPVIVGHQVLLADHRSVVSYHLATGKELFRFDAKDAGLNDISASVDARDPMPRFTLSADAQRAYVRFGRLGLGPKQDADKEEASYLVCLDLTRPEENKPRLLWHEKASVDPKTPAFFEGAPLVHEGRVYIALSKLMGRRVSTAIFCYDTRGRLRWSREVCDCPEFEDNAGALRFRQHLLTWAGGQIAYCSNAGAIVAVDAWTGQPTWGVRYPSRGALLPSFEPSPRDLAPCLYADGLVFAAPLDTDRLFCLDAVTGKICWEHEGIEVVHLLGAAHGRVYVSTRNGVQAISAASGQTDWNQPSEGRLPSLGRGLLAGSWLIWPTTDAKLPYRAVTLREGQTYREDDAAGLLPPEPSQYDPTLFSSMPVGNLAFGQGCLVVAGLEELAVFVPPAKLPKAPSHLPPQAHLDALYRKARQQACAGETVRAAAAYLDLLDAAKNLDKASDWRTLIEGRLQLLVAETHSLAPFIEPRMLASVRLSASKRLGEIALRQGRHEDALAVCRQVLSDSQLRRAWLPGALPQQGLVWALMQKQLLEKKPPSLDAKADIFTLYGALQLSEDKTPGGGLLLQRGENSLKEKRWSQAADAYRRLLALKGTPDLEARGLLGLARSLEGQRDYRSAWKTWTALESKFGEKTDAVSGLAYRKLIPSAKEEPYRGALARVPDGPALPIAFAWEQEDGRLWPMEADDCRDDFFFCTKMGGISCRGISDGALRWRRNLPFAPDWLGRWQNLVLIVGHDGVLALHVADGEAAWSYPAPSRMVRLGSVVDGVPSLLEASAGFAQAQLGDDKLLLLDDQRRFVLLRLDTGEGVWQYASPAAALRPGDAAGFAPYFLRVGAETLVQTRMGEVSWLGTASAKMEVRSRPWKQAPLLVGKRIVFAGEQGRIFACDDSPPHALKWIFQAHWTTSLSGQPCRLFSKDSVLLAVVPRNEGYEWICVDGARGKLLWSVRASQMPSDLDKGSVCIGDTSFYYVRQGKLHARSLNDGSLQWQQPLPTPAARWKVRYAKNYLTVYPRDTSKENDFFVGFVDPWNGRWLQRLNFPEGRGPGEVLSSQGHVLVGVAGKISGFRALADE